MTFTIESLDGLAGIIAARPELQDFSADEWELAHALAGVFQQPNPTAEQCTWFIDDAYENTGDLGPGPYIVTKLGKASGRYTAVVMVNGWLCGVEEGEGHIELTTISDLRGWKITKQRQPPDMHRTPGEAMTTPSVVRLPDCKATWGYTKGWRVLRDRVLYGHVAHACTGPHAYDVACACACGSTPPDRGVRGEGRDQPVTDLLRTREALAAAVTNISDRLTALEEQRDDDLLAKRR